MIHRDSAREQWPGWAHRGRRFRGSEPPGSGLVDGGGFFFCFFLECSQSWSKHRSLGKRKVTSLNKSYLLFSFPLRNLITNFTVWESFLSVSSVQSLCCIWLCDPMNRSTPGLPVHHKLPEFTQTHVHRVGDAIQPSHPLSSPFPPAPNPSQHQGHFQWVTSSHEVATTQQISDANCRVSYNVTQFWHFLPGNSIRSHRAQIRWALNHS